MDEELWWSKPNDPNDFDSELIAAGPWEDEAMRQMELLGWRTVESALRNAGISDGGMDFMAMRENGEIFRFNAKHMKRFTFDGSRMIHIDSKREYFDFWIETKVYAQPIKVDAFICRFKNDDWFAIGLEVYATNFSREWDQRRYYIEKCNYPVSKLVPFMMRRTNGIENGGSSVEQDEQEGEQVSVDQPGHDRDLEASR